MKKINKLSTLVYGDIEYTNLNYISGYSLITTYLREYNKELNNLKSVSITDVLQNSLGENLTGELNLRGPNIVADIFDEKHNHLVSMTFGCNNVEKPVLCNLDSSNYSYNQTGTIELFQGIIISRVIDLAKANKKFINEFDKSHDGLHSVNSYFYLYLVDKEAILFAKNYSYMSITLDNDSLSIDDKNMDIYFRAALKDNEENFLDNIFFNINEAPAFLQERLFEVRKKELINKGIDLNNDNTLNRIRSIFKK